MKMDNFIQRLWIRLRILKANQEQFIKPFGFLIACALMFVFMTKGFGTINYQEITIGTYNIAYAYKNKGDVFFIGKTINDMNVDIIALQSVDVNTERSMKRDQFQHLKLMSGLRNGTFVKSLDYQGGQFGIATMSKMEVLETHKWVLIDRFDHDQFHQSEPRVALLTLIKVNGVEICHVNTQLELQSRELRKKQFDVLIEDIEDLCPRKNVIISGDLAVLDLKVEEFGEGYLRYANTTKDAYSSLQPLIDAGFVDCGPDFKVKTFPTSDPRYRLDFIFFRSHDRRIECRNARLHGKSPFASRHFALKATLRVANG